MSAGGTGAANAADARTNLGISATNTPFTPAGNIAATNTQSAIAELDTEKAALAGSSAQAFSVAAASVADHAVSRSFGDGRYLGETYRNRIINPAMQISQERGTALVDVTNGTIYTVDQWFASLSTTPGGTLRVQQVASATPGGSPFRLRHTVQVADATIAAGDSYAPGAYIEGQMIADARFGTASARQIVVRFGVRSSLAGTFGVRLTNSGGTRSYVTTITISGGEINTDLLRTVVIPGDTSGTWLTDTGVGLTLQITLAAGTTFQTTAGTWQAGNFLTTSGQTNFMGTASATFELFDVGLYVDALAIGAAPSWELPAWDDELRRCQRFVTVLTNQVVFDGSTVNGASVVNNIALPVPMRVTPLVSFNNISYSNASTITNNTVTPTTLRVFVAATANGQVSATYDVFLNGRF